MKGIALVALAAIAALLLVGGCFGPTVQKPAPEGKLCDYNTDCAVAAFLGCEKSHGNIQSDPNTQLYYQVIGMEGQNCKVYIQLIKAKDIPEFMYGMDAICKVAPTELAQKFTSGATIDVSKMDCTGPLYEAAKTAQSLQGTPAK